MIQFNACIMTLIYKYIIALLKCKFQHGQNEHRHDEIRSVQSRTYMANGIASFTYCKSMDLKPIFELTESHYDNW